MKTIKLNLSDFVTALEIQLHVQVGYYDRWAKYIADNCSEFQNSLIYDYKVDFVPIRAISRYIYISYQKRLI